MKLPNFKYYPDPIGNGSIKESSETCQCCSEAKGYMYTGTMYSREQVENICPWCIHSGKAAETYDGFFNSFAAMPDEEEKKWELTENVALEISSRTPGFASFQEEEWQLHCNDGCEFHGLATVGDFRSISKEETERLKKVSYMDDSEIEELKQGDPNTKLDYFFKFKCRHCGEVKFMMDLD